MQRTATKPRVTAPVEDAPPARHAVRRRTVLVGCLLVLVLMVVARWRWGVGADRRLRAVIDDLHARGEPVLPEDFAEPVVPDEKNAAYFLRRAADSIPQTEDDTGLDYPLPTALMPRAADFVASRRQALDDVRRARGLASCVWGRVEDAGWVNGLVRVSRLSIVLRVAIADAMARNDRAAAIEYLRDIVFVGRALQLSPTVLGQWLAVREQYISADQLDKLRPNLFVGPASGAASRDQLLALVEELTDERTPRERLIRSMQAERGAEVRRCEALCRGEGGLGAERGDAPAPLWARWVNAAAGRLARPYIVMKLARELRASQAAVEQVRAATTIAPTTTATVADRPRPEKMFGAAWITHQFNPLFGNGWANTLIASNAKPVVAGERLAEAMYRRDHAGAAPPSTAVLVPEYMPHPISTFVVPQRSAPRTQPASRPAQNK